MRLASSAWIGILIFALHSVSSTLILRNVDSLRKP